tara:strand:+ start:613 stop:1107 length:495 start_codon:yes stop_codon:yes gene_type:complete
MNISKKFKNIIFSKETIVPTFVIFFTFVLDRISKMSIINEQLNNGSLYVNNYLNFDLVWNTGISFGLLSQTDTAYYHLMSLLILFVIIFLIYLIRKADFKEKILFSLIFGGAVGNFYDRVTFYAVPDFIDFHINELHWFTFNIADIFITIGVILLIIKDLVLKK